MTDEKIRLERCGTCPACREVVQARRAYEAGAKDINAYKDALADNPCGAGFIDGPCPAVPPDEDLRTTRDFPRPFGAVPPPATGSDGRPVPQEWVEAAEQAVDELYDGSKAVQEIVKMLPLSGRRILKDVALIAIRRALEDVART